MAGIALIVLFIIILSALTSGPEQAPPVVVMTQTQTDRGSRGAVLFLLLLFALVLLADLALKGS